MGSVKGYIHAWPITKCLLGFPLFLDLYFHHSYIAQHILCKFLGSIIVCNIFVIFSFFFPRLLQKLSVSLYHSY